MICQWRANQVLDLRDTDKSRYFAITEFNNVFIILKRSVLPFLTQERSQFDRKKEKNVVSFTYEQYIICSQTLSQTQLDDITHEQTIICRQLFAGHFVGFWPMKKKKNWNRMIKAIGWSKLAHIPFRSACTTLILCILILETVIVQQRDHCWNFCKQSFDRFSDNWWIWTTLKPRCNEGPRDWQNLFAITTFRFHIFYFNWGKENRSLYRGLLYRGSLYRGSTVFGLRQLNEQIKGLMGSLKLEWRPKKFSGLEWDSNL